MNDEETADNAIRPWMRSPDDFYECAASVRTALAAVRAEEREACAKVADESVESVDADGMDGEVWIASKIGAAIRARAGKHDKGLP